MNSMTGYGRAKVEMPGQLISLELSSVNKKNLEIVVSSPREWQSFEQHALQFLRGCFDRGRIRVSIHLEPSPNFQHELIFDETFLGSDLKSLSSFMEKRGLEFVPTAEIILQLTSLRKKDSGIPPYEEAFPFLEKALISCCEQMKIMRADEGRKLCADLNERTQQLLKLTHEMNEQSHGMANEWKNRLLERLKKAELDLDEQDDRVLKEIALFAEKCDISEELTRLSSHLNQIEETFSSTSSTGRKTEFLLQEVGRELNTICSKSARTTCTKLALDARVEVEKMREQVMNVE